MTVPLESDLLRTFLAVAETGNVTRAAEHVGRTQSAVSMQVRRLEEGVGEALFTRGPRGVALTPRGDQLLPYARRVVGLLDETAVAIRTTPLDGPVRIGVPEEWGQTILPRALAAFAERHPAVEVTVRSATSVKQLAALDKDQLDLVVAYVPDRQLEHDVLCVDPTVWASSVGCRLEDRDPVPVALFNDESNWCSRFAIASLSRSAIPSDCRELTAADGFPPIDASRVILKRNPRRSSAAILGMAEMIRKAFQPGEPLR